MNIRNHSSLQDSEIIFLSNSSEHDYLKRVWVKNCLYVLQKNIELSLWTEFFVLQYALLVFITASSSRERKGGAGCRRR